MNKFDAVKKLVADAQADADAFYGKKNKAAGVRLRGKMQELKGLVQDVRNEVTDLKG